MRLPREERFRASRQVRVREHQRRLQGGSTTGVREHVRGAPDPREQHLARARELEAQVKADDDLIELTNLYVEEYKAFLEQGLDLDTASIRAAEIIEHEFGESVMEDVDEFLNNDPSSAAEDLRSRIDEAEYHAAMRMEGNAAREAVQHAATLDQRAAALRNNMARLSGGDPAAAGEIAAQADALEAEAEQLRSGEHDVTPPSMQERLTGRPDGVFIPPPDPVLREEYDMGRDWRGEYSAARQRRIAVLRELRPRAGPRDQAQIDAEILDLERQERGA